MSKKVSIDEQITALEIIIVNRRGFIHTLEGLVSKKKREPVELEIAERPLPGLEAALRTLKWVRDNKDAIKKVHLASM